MLKPFRHISGLSEAAFVEPTEEWSVANFALFGLVKPPAMHEWWLETTGWEWSDCIQAIMCDHCE